MAQAQVDPTSEPPALTLLDGVRWRGEAIAGERGGVLLAALTGTHPHAVPADRLVAEVWADDEPAHPDKALQVLVSRLRSRTAPDVVVRDGSGYRLGLRDDEVDALRLRAAVGGAREADAAGDLDVVRHLAQDALAIQIGGGADRGVADLVVAARRDRAAAVRMLGRALLARGEYADALPLLEEALERAATDEDRLVDVLRAEAEVRGVPAALDRYAAYADRTRERLGTEPGEALRRLHLELLARDAPVREGLKYDAAPMVGRDEDVSTIRALLSRARVVSIVGAGGLGKTRMAHLVGRLAAQPAVHFVELAGVATPEGVLPEIGNALSVRDSAAVARHRGRDTDLGRRIAERLSGAPTLLILDNCEHVVDAVANLVAFLVATTETVTVLTTSRAPLGISAEEVYLLPQLDRGDSAELFGRRARAARSGVILDDGEVGELVDRLDGLPLAIELAAAKVRVMAVADITRRLTDRFALLTSSDRSVPDRHRTLEAVIDWSWNLLRGEDQEVLRALAAFPDGFSLDAAQAVVGHDPLASIVELVDQSLVVVREGRDGLRYRLLETVREYGLSQLAAAGETESVQDSLRAWAVDRCRDLGVRLFTPDQVATMAEIRRDSGNLAAIMRTALEAGDIETLVPTLNLLATYWSVQGDHLVLLGLTRTALDAVVRAEASDDEPERSYELAGLLTQLMFNEAIFVGQTRPEAIALLRAVAPERGSRVGATASLLLALADAGEDEDKVAVLARLAEDSDPRVARPALQWASQAYENIGDAAASMAAAMRAYELSSTDEGPWDRALTASQIAGLATQFGDWDACRRFAELSMPDMRALGAAEDELQLRCLVAMADIAEGEVDRARSLIEEIVADDRSERTLGWNVALVGQAELAVATGDVDTAMELYWRTLEFAQPPVLEHLDVDVSLTPWSVYGEAAVVFVGSAYGRRDQVVELAETLREKLPRLLAEQVSVLDYPVAGCVFLALGAFDLTAPEPDVDRSARMIALAERFGYQRVLPSMAWTHVEELAERFTPGALGRALDGYSARGVQDLRDEAVRLCGSESDDAAPTPS